MAQKTSFTYKLTEPQQAALVSLLKGGNYRPVHVPYTTIAVQTHDCSISLYNSGKCVLQGKGAADLVMFVMEPLVLKSAGLGYEDVLDPEGVQPHMGVDESGKGDFFGPLVVASAYVDADLARAMREMNVRDSKSITSDNKALQMGRELRGLLGRRFSVVRIGPEAYNRLYAKMRNVNTLLSWAHARAIENLLEAVPDCPRAISDQFGNKEQVRRALMKKGRGIELVQRPRAESDLAVAAASVIARDAFLRALKGMGEEYDAVFPKGASAVVREAAVELGRRRGPDVLLATAKCHFKTTDAVLDELGTGREAMPPEARVVSKPYQRGSRKTAGSARPRSRSDRSEGTS